MRETPARAKHPGIRRKGPLWLYFQHERQKKMLSELGNRRLYVVGGLAILLLAALLNYISFTSVVCIIIIVACSTIVLASNLNESRQLDFVSIWRTVSKRNSKSTASKESDTRTPSKYKPGSRSQVMPRNRGTAREDTMSFRHNESSPGGSRLFRSFGAVKSFLRSPKIAFGASSPMFSPKVGSSNSPGPTPASLPKVHRIRDRY